MAKRFVPGDTGNINKQTFSRFIPPRRFNRKA